MKKLFLSFFVVLLGTVAFSQNTERELEVLMNDKGYSLSVSKSVELSEGETYSYWKTFYSGTDYVIVAFSDEDEVNDVDLYLYDEDGSLYDKSTSSDNVEAIKFSCYTTRDMKIVVKNYDSDYSSYSYEIKFMVFYQ